ncbi:MAG: hypothetical protein VKQ33_09080, partial [Candidatus Sericytochromatia bacterium]|nr:hypothetical protein [Candidatus Sericytochromatia bacterium]
MTPARFPRWWAHLRYAVDRLLGLGTLAQVGLLGVLTLLVVGLAVAFLVASGITPDGHPHGFDAAEAWWVSLAHLFDGGTMGGDPPDWPYRAVMLVVTVSGLLLMSALVGLLTTGLVGLLEELRRGRSLVLERDHTLILGWTPAVFTIVAELAIANEHRQRPRIVILAEVDKVEMEQAIRKKVPSLGRTRVICRTGSPIDPDDLAIVAPDEARSIVVLAPEGPDADTQVLKTILALTHGPHRKAGRYHIVAELNDPKKREVAALVGGDELEVVLSSEVVTRLTVQTCFQSGLSLVYTELFDFAGDEIYMAEEPSLVGRTFLEACLAYDRCALMGLRLADGRQLLNPPADTVLGAGDVLIAIAQDQGHLRPGGAPRLDEAAIRLAPRTGHDGPRRTLILGWNRRAPAIINEMDYYVADGSELTVVAELPEPAEVAALRPLLRHQQVHYWRGDTTDFTTLEALDLWSYQHVIVLGYTELLGQHQADARTLETLLYLRTLVERTGARVNIVSEMLHARNRDLARVTRVDDFIVSHTL